MNQLTAIDLSGDGLTPGLVPALSKLLSDAGALVDRDRSAAKAYIDRALALVQLEAERHVDGQSDTLGPKPPRVLAPWQVGRVAAFIDAHLDRAIQIRELAVLTRLTVGYFSRAFRGSFGAPPRAYVTQRRIDFACHLMLTTDAPLSRIALDCGLADQAHFSKVFSRAYGIPPGAWRRARRGSVGPAVTPRK
jgi:AraC-like DNA-binding protein